MGMSGLSAFEIQSSQEVPPEEREETNLTHTRLTKSFRDDVEGGESSANCSWPTVPPKVPQPTRASSASSAGFTVALAVFVLHSAISDGPRGEPSSALSVLPDPATGELRGPRGEARGSPSSSAADTPSRSTAASSDGRVGLVFRGFEDVTCSVYTLAIRPAGREGAG